MNVDDTATCKTSVAGYNRFLLLVAGLGGLLYGVAVGIFPGCPVVYFITAASFLLETKGQTLEQIEAHFEGKNPG